MSDAGSRDEDRDDLEDEEEGSETRDGDDEEDDDSMRYTPAISAVAPRVLHQEEGQIEVSASPAFQVLDDLFQSGKLTGTKVALLKAKYTELHESLKRTRDSETQLLMQAKEFTTELEKQNLELEKADNFPESSNTEVSKLREQLLKHGNELAEADDRQYQLIYKLESLEEEKKIVEREYSRLPKQGEVEKKVKELQAACDDMRKEIAQRLLEAKTLREDLDSTQRQYNIDNKEFEIITEEMEKLKSELVQVNTLPGQTSKETDKLMRQKNDVENRRKQLDQEYKDLQEAIRLLEQKRKEYEEDQYDNKTNLDQQHTTLSLKERHFDGLMKEYEHAKEREAVLMGDRATLDLSLRHVNLEKKTQHDVHSRKCRERERDNKNLKKLDLQMKVAEESLNHNKLLHDKAKSQMETLPKDDGTMLQKRHDLQKEVEQTKRALAQQNSLTAVEHVKLEASAAEEQNLLYEQCDLRIEVVELTRLAAIKADEREQKARDFMRAEMRFHRAREDLRTKHLQIQDHQKKHHEMQIKLKEFAKLYDIIKNERNKCVNLIQTSTQKAAEMREKIKILQNEIEILRTAVMHKDRQLQQQRLKHMNIIVVRDSMRNEVSKQQHVEEDMREKQEQQKMDISKLNLMINHAEEEMVKLRKRYETAVQHRNERGVQLIERNEEVCIFYEKVNIQDQMVRNGNVELQAREEEIRFIKMQLAEDKRGIDLLRKETPNKRCLEQELVTVQIQLQQCQDRMLELEKQLEDPTDDTRVRFLEGKDMSPAELQNKLEELEMRLAEKEESLLEKDLVFEQVTRLSERVKTKAASGKEDTLMLAKKVNDLQCKIKEVTRKMMALVSELSMNQASALRLQQEVKEKEAEVEQCYIRMEKGQPPTSEAEREWLRYLRDGEFRQKDREELAMLQEEEEQYTTAGGITTTAEPRPNAYIPDDDGELPIPRPYGKHTPFKPSEPGSTMRHIRKPIPKPIEI